MIMSELKACPFCGGYTEHAVAPDGDDDSIFCDCGASEEFLMNERFDQWNRRPIEDALNKRIAELEATLKKERHEHRTEKADYEHYNNADSEEIDKLKFERDKCKAALGGLLQWDTSYPLNIVLEKLSVAAEDLLNRYGYDGHGWEIIYYSIQQSKAIQTKIEAACEAMKGLKS